MTAPRDPLYAQILEGLEAGPDPDLFERVAIGLLPEIFPGLVPVRGGSDLGMDGELPGEGERGGPVIVTTGRDVIGNLTQNLSSYLKTGKPGRRCVIATSRALTARRRENLRKRATGLGFAVHQILDRHAMADLLYRDAARRKELLGITGEPPALSPIAPGGRRLVDIEPVGRQEDLEWLRRTAGDRVLVGEPGSGKTFLLQLLAREGLGLFLTRSNAAAIADAVREQAPRVIFVDDAHSDAERLTWLQHAREELDAEFDILAVTWPGYTDEVMAALGGPERVERRDLELLTRDEILEIIRALDVLLSDAYMRELVDQSHNKPALAVTLAQLVRRGDHESLQAVFKGEVLEGEVLSQLKTLAGEDVRSELASIALAGDAGLTVEELATLLGESSSEALRKVTTIAAGGVISVRPGRHLTVSPGQLRFALVRSVFFDPEAPSLDYRSMLSSLPDRRSAVETIVHAALWGAEISASEIVELLDEDSTQSTWRALAAHPPTAAWAVDNFQGPASNIARYALESAPGKVIPKVLQEAAGAGDLSLTANPHPALRVLQEWVQRIEDARQRAVPRRRTLAQSAVRFADDGGDLGAAIAAALIALSPMLKGLEPDAGLGRTIRIRSGILTPSQLRKVEEIWKTVRPLFERAKEWPWASLEGTLWYWIYPVQATMGKTVRDEIEAAARNIAELILRDILELADGHIGLAAAIRRLGARIDLEFDGPMDPVFEVLFPSDRKDLAKAYEGSGELTAEMAELAASWLKAGPERATVEIQRVEREAASIGQTWPRATPSVISRLAEMVPAPVEWLRVFREMDVPVDLVAPFLKRISEERPDGWQGIATSALEDPNLRPYAASFLLTEQELPKRIETALVDALSDVPMVVETSSLRNEVPVVRLSHLLEVEDSVVAAAVAIGHWTAKPRGWIDPKVATGWKQAILRIPPVPEQGTARFARFEFWLGAILAADPELANEWLLRRVELDQLAWAFNERSPLARAVGALEQGARVELVGRLPAGHFVLDQLLPEIVKRDPAIYGAVLLRSDFSENLKRAPLHGVPDERWAALAEVALAAGHGPECIADASFQGVQVVSGYGVEHWGRWREAFQELLEGSTGALHQVAEYGLREAERRIEQGRASERAEAVGR